jgi:hypothetical protein
MTFKEMNETSIDSLKAIGTFSADKNIIEFDTKAIMVSESGDNSPWEWFSGNVWYNCSINEFESDISKVSKEMTVIETIVAVATR